VGASNPTRLPEQSEGVLTWGRTAIESGALFALLHFALGLRIYWDPRNIHDEGLSTYGYSRLLGDVFADGFFFLKVRPALALAYFLPARLGLDFFLITHLAVGSIAVLVLARVARAMGQRRPWIPALCLALSPLYLWCDATGISNSSGVAVAILVLYALEVRKLPFVGGFLLGILPFVRVEAAAFAAVLAPYLIHRDRDPRFVLGLVIWPLAYLGAGALHHADPLWFVRRAPDVTRLDPVIEAQVIQGFATHGFNSAFGAMLAVSPALPLLVFTRPRRLLGVERVLLAFTAVYLLIFFAAHVGGDALGPLLSVGYTSRNLLLVAAAVPLLFGRVTERWSPQSPAVLRLGLLAIIALIGAGPVLAAPGMDGEGYSVAALRRARLQEMTESLARVGDAARRHEVYTNSHAFGQYLARTNALPGVRVRYMVPADISSALNATTDPDDGQRERLLESLPRAVFGPIVLPRDLSPEHVPDGTLFLTIEDPRTSVILPAARWSPYLHPLPHAPGVELAIFCRSERGAASVRGERALGPAFECPSERSELP